MPKDGSEPSPSPKSQPSSSPKGKSSASPKHAHRAGKKQQHNRDAPEGADEPPPQTYVQFKAAVEVKCSNPECPNPDSGFDTPDGQESQWCRFCGKPRAEANGSRKEGESHQGNGVAKGDDATQAQPPRPPVATQPRKPAQPNNSRPPVETVPPLQAETPVVPIQTLPPVDSPAQTLPMLPSTAEVASSGAPTPAAATSTAPPKKKEDPGDWWWKCWRCQQKAKVFCVDCKKGEQYLCHKCCAFEHDFDYKKLRFHSLEAINPKQTTSLILAIADAIVLPLVFWYLVRQTGIPEGYNDGIDVCPLVDQGRSLVFSIDAGLSLYTKHYFMLACNIEDGYVRLWVDVFVRCIATNTDSLFLLAVTAFRAQLYHKIVIRTAFVPIAMIIQAIFSTIVYFFTLGLPNLERNKMLAPFQRVLTNFVDRVQAPAKRLPNTLSRSRPSMQYKDYFSYKYGRLPRQFRWNKESAGNRLEALSLAMFRIPICIRCCCMFLRMGWIFAAIANVVVPDQFWKSPNIDFTQVSKDEYSGVLLESIGKWAMHFVFRHATTVADFTVTYTPQFVVQAIAFLMPFLVMARDILLENYVAILGGLIVLAIPWSIYKSVKKFEKNQLRKFNQQAEDHVNYPFTTYEARMKWMPLIK